MRVLLVFFFTGCFIFGYSQAVVTNNLMPQPKSIQGGVGKLKLTDAFVIGVKSSEKDSILYLAVNRMFATLERRTGLYFHQPEITPKEKDTSATLWIDCKRPASMQIGIDESYRLTVNSSHIVLEADNTIGILRGMETILQLLDFDSDGPYFPSLTIEDAPRLAWRGLMIDVARHFVPLDNIKRNIDAMAAVKLNVLHMHFTDDQGFRIESKIFPGLHEKGSNGKYYTQAQIRDMVQYAANRGIIIVPEFDMPGHSTSWFAAYPELASAPGPYEPGPPLKFPRKDNEPFNVQQAMQVMQTAPIPSFDPTKESVYVFLDKFFAEMATLFPSSYFHIGADENNGVAWKQNPSIVAFMQKNKIANTHELQAYFVKRVSDLVRKHKRQVIGWEELFTKDLSKDVLVQVWLPMGSPGTVATVAAAGNKVILSKGLYLDHFLPAYIHYQLDLGAPGIFGAEAAQWAEICDASTIETRMWPRTAAIAERFWSPSTVSDVSDMYRRLYKMSRLLDEAGLLHESNYEKMIRRFARNENVAATKNLMDVLSPVKGYKRLFAFFSLPAAAYYPNAPLTRAADIATVDPIIKWEFRKTVENYLVSKNPDLAQQIRKQLIIWRDNDQQLQSLFRSSSQAKEISMHSKNLALLSSAALDVMDHGKATDSTAQGNIQKLITDAKISNAEVELAVLPELEALITGNLAPLPKQFPIF